MEHIITSIKGPVLALASKFAAKQEDTTSSVLCQFTYAYQSLGITSIAWPKLGCTNGKLNWENQVKPLMYKYLNDLKINCEIYE